MRWHARRSGPKNAWSEELFDRERKAIGERLAQAETDAGSHRIRLKLAQDALRDLATDDTHIGRLRRYIYAVYILVYEERHGGLARREIDQLMELAYGILRAQGVEPKRSRLAHMYGDLHLMRSQIYRKEGRQWEAAWEQQVAMYLSGSKPTGGRGFQLLATANRLLRLGHATAAIEQLDEALALDLPSKQRHRALVARAQASMLAGRRDEAEKGVAALESEPDLAPAIQTELVWQRLLFDMLASQDPWPLLRATKRGGSCYAAGYVIEACMWTFAVQSRARLDDLPSLAYVRRNAELKALEQGAWLDAAQAIQGAYDKEVPFVLRLGGVATALKERAALVSVDKELLLWCTALRWFKRNRVTEAARLVQCEYEALSLRLSDGRSKDVLGLCAAGRDDEEAEVA